MKKYCLALDLKDDPALIAEYERHHQNVWPEVVESIHRSGILRLEIHRVANRLVMLLETEDSFSFDRKNEQDAADPDVQRWEALMWQYQQALPGSKPGEKWRVMERVCAL